MPFKIDQEDFNRKAQHILDTVVRPQVERYEQSKRNEMEKTQEQKEIKAENLVDNFVKQWKEKNNTEHAVYSAYHYDAMIAFAEYYNELNKSE